MLFIIIFFAEAIQHFRKCTAIIIRKTAGLVIFQQIYIIAAIEEMIAQAFLLAGPQYLLINISCPVVLVPIRVINMNDVFKNARIFSNNINIIYSGKMLLKRPDGIPDFIAAVRAAGTVQIYYVHESIIFIDSSTVCRLSKAVRV